MSEIIKSNDYDEKDFFKEQINDCVETVMSEEEQSELFEKAFTNTLIKLAKEPEELFDNNKLRKKCNNLLIEQIKLKKQLQQKDNIIKEVREKLNNYTTRFDVLNYQISDLAKKELLGILDKENK